MPEASKNNETGVGALKMNEAFCRVYQFTFLPGLTSRKLTALRFIFFSSYAYGARACCATALLSSYNGNEGRMRGRGNEVECVRERYRCVEG